MTASAAASRSALLRFALRLVVGIGLLLLILSRVDLRGAKLQPGPLLYGGVAGAALLLLLGQVVAALRWKTIWGEGSPPWAYLSRLYLIGGFFSLFLPTAIGGDAVRAAAATQASTRVGGVVATVLLDRILGMVALGTYGVIGLVLAPSVAARLFSAATLQAPSAPVLFLIGILGIGALAGVVVLLRRSQRARRAMQDATAAVRALLAAPRILMLALALAFVVQAIYLLLWLVLALAVPLPVPLATLLVTVPIVTAATMLPITLNGLGVREGAWLLLLGGSGIPAGQIVSFSLLYFAANLIIGIVGGLLFMAYGTAPAPGSDAAPE